MFSGIDSKQLEQTSNGSYKATPEHGLLPEEQFIDCRSSLHALITHAQLADAFPQEVLPRDSNTDAAMDIAATRMIVNYVTAALELDSDCSGARKHGSTQKTRSAASQNAPIVRMGRVVTEGEMLDETSRAQLCRVVNRERSGSTSLAWAAERVVLPDPQRQTESPRASPLRFRQEHRNIRDPPEGYKPLPDMRQPR